MSDSVTFHTQLAYILDVLANKALEEICKVVDDGYALLRFEVSRHQHENEALKKRLKMMELKAAQGYTDTSHSRQNTAVDQLCQLPKGTTKGSDKGRFLCEEIVFDQQTDITLGEDGEPSAVEDTPVHTVVKKGEDGRPDLLIIKEERLEDERECSVLPEGVNIRGEGAVELRTGGGERTPIQDTRDKPAKHTEELNEQHRTRHSVWEVSRLENALKEEPENDSDNQRVQHGGSEHIAGRLNCRDSDYAVSEMPDQLGGYVTQGSSDTGSEDPSCSYATEIDSDSLLVQFGDGPGINGSTPCDFGFTSESIQAQCRDDPGKKMNVCEYCGRGFARRNALEIHQRVHTGEKPFRCMQCGKQFAHSGNLKVHQSVHTGERRFRCTLCGKSFISSSHLKRHWSVHTREKPFSCAQCGKRFSDSGSCKRHQIQGCKYFTFRQKSPF